MLKCSVRIRFGDPLSHLAAPLTQFLLLVSTRLPRRPCLRVTRFPAIFGLDSEQSHGDWFCSLLSRWLPHSTLHKEARPTTTQLSIDRIHITASQPTRLIEQSANRSLGAAGCSLIVGRLLVGGQHSRILGAFGRMVTRTSRLTCGRRSGSHQVYIYNLTSRDETQASVCTSTPRDSTPRISSPGITASHHASYTHPAPLLLQASRYRTQQTPRCRA